MKNLKYFIIITIVSLITFSCENDGGTSVIDLRIGAVSNIEKNASLNGFLNLLELEAGNDVQVGFTINIFQGDVTSADAVGFYFSGANVYGPVTIKAGISAFPYSQTLDQNELLALFSELNSISDIIVGDKLLVTSKLYLNDGTFINIFNDDGTRNYGSDVHGSSQFSTNVTFPISCPSNLGGTYAVVSNGTSTDPGPVNNPLVNFPYTVIVTDIGGGSYTISDGAAGVYIDWYSIYGYTFETEGNFTDVCNSLSGEWGENFGGTITLTGTVNSGSILTIHWENNWGDIIDAVYTLQ